MELLVVVGAITVLMGAFYGMQLRAKEKRRLMRCPQCGETARDDLLNKGSCVRCGCVLRYPPSEN